MVKMKNWLYFPRNFFSFFFVTIYFKRSLKEFINLWDIGGNRIFGTCTKEKFHSRRKCLPNSQPNFHMPRILDVSGGVTWRRKRRGKVEREKKKRKVAQIVVSSQARNGVAPLRWIDRKSVCVWSSSQMAALHRNVSLLRGKNRVSHRTSTSARAVVRPRISRDGSRG